MKYLQYISYALIIIGALNWGLVGLFGVDLVAAIFGPMSAATRIIYSLVGLAAIVNLILEFTVCKAHTRCYAYHRE
ncbi:MAG: hypothetical protein A2287_00670 [Candidatus Melainabacteria bacterium RIFOXYA12_FULL_32_12]|nr:MAG: hypothetical protein A2104_03395 [Candidatus Melainabacteria bacterium GWF2_32_7]OGI21025.1 MAG: hypothetical protein A2255_10575 [Candidatus Melainabacteria bacterium RIFOXYA2_FULL_32_9]OGI29152.1 MAG: hypothetical protein A2287_00670 [Candidatus Melainabacteria bacterium RIFOXYA12_FULL_32_12]